MRTWIVDTNVLIDIFQADPEFGPRSLAALESLSENTLFVINPVIYAELSAWIDSKERLDSLLPHDLFRYESIPADAAFLAGQAFRRYKNNSGGKNRMLADFLIGAHAATQGYGLISRDTGFSRYFHLELLDPSRMSENSRD